MTEQSFHFSSATRPALTPTQFPIQQVMVALSAGTQNWPFTSI